MGENVFSNGVNTELCVLKVPEGSVPAYQAADQWKDFFVIEEFASAVDEILLDEATATDIYTIDGRLYMRNADVEDVKLSRGLYIIGGRKVIVK